VSITTKKTKKGKRGREEGKENWGGPERRHRRAEAKKAGGEGEWHNENATKGGIKEKVGIEESSRWKERGGASGGVGK